VYRRVSILSQGNKIPLRRVRDQRRVAARHRVCDSEARALALSQFFWGNGKPAQRVRAARAFD
jgi:hypothetical protein